MCTCMYPAVIEPHGAVGDLGQSGTVGDEHEDAAVRMQAPEQRQARVPQIVSLMIRFVQWQLRYTALETEYCAWCVNY